MKNKSLFKILQNVSITLIFISVAIFICSVTGLIKLTPFLIDALGLIIIVCLACIMSLPWIKYIEQNKYKVLSIVFLVSIIICAILWAVCLIIIVNIATNNGELSSGILTLIKVSLILSIQLLVSSTFASIILKYKKSMIPFQVITYISYIFIDVYFSTLIISLDSNINFSAVADVLFSKVMITLIIIALVFVAISNAIIKRTDKRKMTEIADSHNDIADNINESKQISTNEKTPAEKLQDLKQLYENDLITKEEYEKKKADILENM